MNKNSRIRVKTPVGETQSAETGPIVTQGSVDGAVISAVNLDNGVKEYFHERKDDNDEEDVIDPEKDETVDEVMYGDINLKPLIYQDDLFNASETPAQAQIVNNKMDNLIESKLLDFNHSKCHVLVIGAKKARAELKEMLRINPLTLSGKVLSVVEEEKYLGCVLAGSVSQSVTATVNARIGLAKRAVYEIRSIMEDSRANAIGAVQVGMNIWEMSVILMLLHGAENWSDISKQTMKKLDDINSLFLSNLLGVSKKGCPAASLYLETGTLRMRYRILMIQLKFIHHIALFLPIVWLG